MRSLYEVFGRRVNARFALDRLHHEARHVGIFQGRFQCCDVVVWNDFEARSKGAESAGRIGVGTEAYDGGRAAVEVAFTR